MRYLRFACSRLVMRMRKFPLEWELEAVATVTTITMAVTPMGHRRSARTGITLIHRTHARPTAIGGLITS